ncbi:MAG: hypothetical protein IJK26_05370 [Clostridia bacterium]|jgi:hypothetical protein|nr:hypothetical protein [Clostridia bacterium]
MNGLQLPKRTVYAIFKNGKKEEIASQDTLDKAEAKKFYDDWNRHQDVFAIVLCDENKKNLAYYSRADLAGE